MPLHISKPIPVRNSPTGATPPKPAVLHALRRRFPGSVSGASLSDPYTPRRSGKAERSRRKDNEGFCASRKFCSLDAFAAQLALRQRYYSNSPLRPLNRLSPKRLLSRLSSLEPYLCLTYNFSALPPEHRLDGVQARSTRSQTDGHEQNGARRPPRSRLRRPFLPPEPPPQPVRRASLQAARRVGAPPGGAASPRAAAGRCAALCGAGGTGRRTAVRYGGFLRRRRMRQKSRAGVWYPVRKGGQKKETARTRFSECAPSFGEKEEKRDENKSVRFPLSG